MEQEIMNLAVAQDYIVRNTHGSVKGIVTCCLNKATMSYHYALESYEREGKVYHPFFEFKELISYLRRLTK